MVKKIPLLLALNFTLLISNLFIIGFIKHNPTTSQEGKFILDLLPNSTITSPLTLTGKADNSWYYEGVFPVKLIDENKNLIKQGILEQVPPDNWTNPGYVRFQGTIEFLTTSKSGFLRFEKDSGSGLEQPYFEIPVKFKFVNTSSFKLSDCPKSGWLDCMPGPGVERPLCNENFYNWAKINCPDFKGFAQ